MPDSRTWPVRLHRAADRDSASLDTLADAALGASRSVPFDALALARVWAPRLPLPGAGRTLELWEALATVAAVSLSVARAVEPHLDARAILAEAGVPDPSGTWGVFAAEGPCGRLEATPTDDGWTLDGIKPWCSLAGNLDHALVTAWVDDRVRGLFAIDLSHPGVRLTRDGWHARGLRDIASRPINLSAVPATAVGEPGWYLQRNGFAWGGIGVASVWYGGAVGVARRLLRQSQERTPDQVALLHLGRVDVALTTARLALAEAAEQVDAGTAGGAAGALLAARVRHVVADTVETVLIEAEHALGPGPQALEPEHAERIADLRLYVRQHHAERDSAHLGGLVLTHAEKEGLPW